MEIATIVTGGTLPREDRFYFSWLKRKTYLIAADSGLDVYFRLKIVPDLILGDFDSVNKEALDWAKKQSIPIHTFPCDKDAGDTQLAIDIVVRQQFTEVYILGGIGSRLDHTLANFYLLVYADRQGLSAHLINPDHHVRLLTSERSLTVSRKDRLLSIVPITEKLEGLSLKGFRWDLDRATVKRGQSIGLSNYLSEREGHITLEQGMAFVLEVREQ